MNVDVTTTVAKIVGINWPNVRTRLSCPPSSLSTAQFPVLFVRNAEVMKDQRSLSFAGGLPVVRLEIVVLLEAARQSTQEDAYAAMRTMLDDVAKTLDINAALLQLDDYGIKEGFEPVQDTAYFSVTAEVRFA